jgi:hypothetical protein
MGKQLIVYYLRIHWNLKTCSLGTGPLAMQLPK